MQWLAAFHHHKIADVDDVVDRRDAKRSEAVDKPGGAGADFYAAEDTDGVAGAEVGAVDGDAGLFGCTRTR